MSRRRRRHRVLELSPDLLLVFKPGGHVESEHRHDYTSRIRLLRGSLRVLAGGRARRLGVPGRTVTIAAGEPHATVAEADTWLVVERLAR